MRRSIEQVRSIVTGRLQAASLSLFFLLTTLFPGWSMGAIYRCQYEDGPIEFRQSPCEKGSGEEIEVEIKNTSWVAPKRGLFNTVPVKKKNVKRRSKRSVATAANEKSCWRAEKGIERISRKMRQGYRPAQGEKWRQRRRELEEYVYKFCR